MADEQQIALIELAAEIVSAYAANNSVSTTELTKLIGDVHSALSKASTGAVEVREEPLKPAVPIKKSISSDYLICLEDGKQFKSLKRHLRTKYDMSPDEYRAKWGLPPDYPMVAPNYAASRSELAKSMGLGQQRRKVVAPVEPAPKGKKAAPGKPGRKKAAA